MQTQSTEGQPGPAAPIEDVHTFVRRRARAEGMTPVAAMPRVAPALAAAGGDVRWSVQGLPADDAVGRPAGFIELKLATRVALGCVRCLEPVEVDIRCTRRFKIVRDELLAEREDAEVDDYDVLASPGPLELAELIQDELLLALPLAPRHARCALPLAAGSNGERLGQPGQGGADMAGAAPAPGPTEGAGNHPFAALASMRTRPGPPKDGSDPGPGSDPSEPPAAVRGKARGGRGPR